MAAVPFPGAAASDWGDPPRAAPAGAAPTLSVDGFEGPLDWLLELARAQKIDLARLSIAALAEAFVVALEAALVRQDGQPAASLARWGDWLVMAAWLALLRSRLLLPADAAEARQAQSEAEALRRQLVSRAEANAVADWLERRPQLGQAVFGRGMPDARATDRVGDVVALLRACLVALRLPQQATVYRPRPPVLWRVGDAIARIGQLLGALPDGSPLAAFLPGIDGADASRELRCRAALASTLVAGLELARGGALTLDQDGAWTPVRVHRPDGARPGELGGAERVA